MNNSQEEKILKDAQYRKGLSIAFFNATNAAISLCSGMNVHEKETLNKIVELRDFFLEEHKNYYAKVISAVGLNYNKDQAIEKLNKAKTIEDLQTAWRMLSQDERADKDIIGVAQKAKVKLTTNEKA